MLFEHGAKVVIVDIADSIERRTAKRLGNAICIHADISQTAQIDALLQQAVKQVGGVDLVVNSAVNLLTVGLGQNLKRGSRVMLPTSSAGARHCSQDPSLMGLLPACLKTKTLAPWNSLKEIPNPRAHMLSLGCLRNALIE